MVLQSDTVPSTLDEETYRDESVGLLVNEDSDRNALAFSTNWSMVAFDRYLRTLFPLLFQYLDLTYGIRDGVGDKFHWRLLRRSYNKAILYGKSIIDGRDLKECRMGSTTKNKDNFGLMIGKSL